MTPATGRMTERASAFLTSMPPRMRALAQQAGPTWLQAGPAWLLPAPGREPAVAGPGGALEVRLAASTKEVRRAQRLRYKVFYEEGGAVASGVTRLSRRDADAYDAVCDHLLVLDHAAKPKPFRAAKPKVVGTYRLLRREVAEATGGFYSAGEFDLAPLLRAQPDLNLLELGRSCVLRSYRSRKTVELLWQGLWTYALRHGIDAMVGCASLPGTDPGALAVPLSYLHHFAASPAPWRVRPRPGLRVEMDRLPLDAIEKRAAFKALPPLLKGYLRVGATVGDGAAVDLAFGTTDVFVVMPVAAIRGRYLEHFGPAANRRAA